MIHYPLVFVCRGHRTAKDFVSGDGYQAGIDLPTDLCGLVEEIETSICVSRGQDPR